MPAWHRAVALLLLGFAQISGDSQGICNSIIAGDLGKRERPAPQAPPGWCGPYSLAHGRARPATPVPLLASVALRCEHGYQLAGPGEANVQCLKNGTFTEGKTCWPVSCGALAVPGGIADPPGEIVYPRSARLACGRGYKLSPGSTSRQCLGSGYFSKGASCLPAESWTKASVLHARADLLAELEIAITGRDFTPGAFYECHLTRRSLLGDFVRVSTMAIATSPTRLRCSKPKALFAGGESCRARLS